MAETHLLVPKGLSSMHDQEANGMNRISQQIHMSKLAKAGKLWVKGSKRSIWVNFLNEQGNRYNTDRQTDR